jgi:hypothetical protein
VATVVGHELAESSRTVPGDAGADRFDRFAIATAGNCAVKPRPGTAVTPEDQ